MGMKPVIIDKPGNRVGWIFLLQATTLPGKVFAHQTSWTGSNLVYEYDCHLWDSEQIEDSLEKEKNYVSRIKS